MTRIVADVVLAVGSSLAASIIVKVTVIMALTLIGLRLARKSRAAVRHALLAAAFALSLLVPIASILVPSVRLVQLPIAAAGIAESPGLPPPTAFAPAAGPVTVVSWRADRDPVASSASIRAAAGSMGDGSLAVLDTCIYRAVADAYATPFRAALAARILGSA